MNMKHVKRCPVCLLVKDSQLNIMRPGSFIKRAIQNADSCKALPKTGVTVWGAGPPTPYES